MQTTDKSKRSTSSTASTGISPEVISSFGGWERLIHKSIRLALCDLTASKKKLRDDAMRYIVSSQFEDDCKRVSVDCNAIRAQVMAMIPLKRNQSRAIIKNLIKEIEVNN